MWNEHIESKRKREKNQKKNQEKVYMCVAIKHSKLLVLFYTEYSCHYAFELINTVYNTFLRFFCLLYK